MHLAFTASLKMERKEEEKVIIAMKGHPGTGKSTIAHSLASTLKIPLIDKDDIRDCTLPLQNTLSLISPATASTLLNNFSYDAIWQLASTQLRLGLSVVIDSPLSRRAHFESLLHLASSTGAHLLIVECRPSDQALWRRRLESRGSGNDNHAAASWHKPSTWRDIERLLEVYGGCTEYDVDGIPKLVVDTTAPVGVEELVYGVVKFIAAHTGSADAYVALSGDVQ